MNAHKIATLAFAVGASVPSAGSAAQLPEGMGPVPEEIRTLAGEDKALLAYKWVHDDSGGRITAIILRAPKEPAPDVAVDRRPDYSCELVLLHEDKSGRRAITGRTTGAVNCDENDFNRRAFELELNDRLALSPLEVSYRNDYQRLGSYSYAFAFAGGQWHLSWANSIYTENEKDGEGVLVFEEKVSYPRTLPLISMQDFDPEDIRKTLSKHRSLVQ